MTIIKFLIWKLKNINKNTWLLLVLKVFVRLLGIFNFIYLLNFLSKSVLNEQRDYYIIISSIFYISFFVFLDSIIKVSASFSLSEKIVRPLNLLKWFPLLLTMYLVYSSLLIHEVDLNKIDYKTPAFLWTKISPLIITPNLSFIIITILIFFASTILNTNKKLKEENDLTI